MRLREQARTTLVLVLFAVAFIALTTLSYTRTSATWDEPQHLTSGYLALTKGDYRLDPEHPPGLRLWAALPLLAFGNLQCDPAVIDGCNPTNWADIHPPINEFSFSHDFFYRQNDADRLLYASRFMVVLLGVALGLLLFLWVKEWFGFWPAVWVLGFYTVEPNLQAHASLVTTDLAITCFFFGTVYFLWRTTQRPHLGNLAGLVLFFVLAMVSKFSAVLLGPVILLLLAVRVGQRKPWTARLVTRPQKALAAAGIVFLLVVATWGGVWAIYRFRYAPSDNPTWLFHADRDAFWRRHPSALQSVGAWVDAHHLLPNVYVQGFLLGQSRAGGRTMYLAGETSHKAWWYYFPLAFLIKTPVTLIFLLLGGLVVCLAQWKASWLKVSYALGPPLVYLAFAIHSPLNIGLRHILPVYPFVLLIAAFALAQLCAARRRLAAGALGVLGLAAVIELAAVYPHTLSFFNCFIGGPRNGHQYLADSNIDWGQDLKGLKRWMQQQHLTTINLGYFGTADPEYYGIHWQPLPGHPIWVPHSLPPRLPGFVAVSTQCLLGVGLRGPSKYFYQALRDRTPDACIGYSIRIYWMDREWWAASPSPAPAPVPSPNRAAR